MIISAYWLIPPGVVLLIVARSALRERKATEAHRSYLRRWKLW